MASDRAAQIQANFKQIDELEEQIKKLRDVEKLSETMSELCKGEVTSLSIPFKPRKLLQGHFGKIYAMDWGHDETTVMSAAQDGSLIIWNALTVNKINVINLRSSWVMSCAMSPSGKMTASGGLDNICTIYKIPDPSDGSNALGDLKTHKELAEHTGYLSGAAFLNDEKVISCSGDGSCILWDIQYSRWDRQFKGHESDVMDVTLIPDKNLFISGSCDMTCKVWDHRDAKADVLTFPGHGADINAVDSSLEGNYFISAGDEAHILMYDIRSYGPVQQYSSQDVSASITSCAFSNSARLIFAGYDDNCAHVWDTLTGEKVADLEAHTNRVSCLGVNKTGSALCTGGWDQLLRVWA